MRLKKKYKIFNQLKNWNALEYLPLRICNSKKKKWKSNISRFKPFSKKKYSYITQFSINLPNKRWETAKKLFKKGLDLKRLYYHVFDSSITNKFLKSNLTLLNQYNKNYFAAITLYTIKPAFRVDILLWLLGFCSSIFEARNLILNKYLEINYNNNISANYFLKVGDFLNFKKLFLKKIYFNRVIFQKQFFCYVEIDYYTKNILVVNDLKDLLSSKDNPQIFFKNIDIRKLISYILLEY